MRIKRPLALAAALTVLAGGCSANPEPRRAWDERTVRADPSRVIAAELAFARAAQEKGQWTAFAEYATGDAVMFVPDPVNARDWLRRQTDPPQAVRWQPHQVWSSCDGSLAVTRGAWQRPDGSAGYFTTVWARQRDDQYKWVMDQGDTLAQPLADPEMIDAKVAQCAPGPAARWRERERPTVRALACADRTCGGGAVSADGTLEYEYSVDPAGARQVIVRVREEGAMREVMRSDVSA